MVSGVLASAGVLPDFDGSCFLAAEGFSMAKFDEGCACGLGLGTALISTGRAFLLPRDLAWQNLMKGAPADLE